MSKDKDLKEIKEELRKIREELSKVSQAHYSYSSKPADHVEGGYYPESMRAYMPCQCASCKALEKVWENDKR